MGMLKRKRSESEFSFSSGSTFSSPPRPGSSSNLNLNFSSTEASSTISPIRYGVTPSHLPSRTLKRFRDNRLSEEQIYHNTLQMLYSAQQHHLDEPQHLPAQPPSHPTTSSLFSSSSLPASATPTTSPGQRSLHAFWNIPPASSSRPDMLPPPIEKAALAVLVHTDHSTCEDCEARVASPDDDQMMMDVDDQFPTPGDASRCVACGKVVCGSCCVSNLGAEPRCLACAGRSERWSA